MRLICFVEKRGSWRASLRLDSSAYCSCPCHPSIHLCDRGIDISFFPLALHLKRFLCGSSLKNWADARATYCMCRREFDSLGSCGVKLDLLEPNVGFHGVSKRLLDFLSFFKFFSKLLGLSQ